MKMPLLRKKSNTSKVILMVTYNHNNWKVQFGFWAAAQDTKVYFDAVP